MESVFKAVAGSIALGVESAAALIIAFGAIEALYGAVLAISSRSQPRWPPQRGLVAVCGMACSRTRVRTRRRRGSNSNLAHLERNRAIGSHRGNTNLSEFVLGTRSGQLYGAL